MAATAERITTPKNAPDFEYLWHLPKRLNGQVIYEDKSLTEIVGRDWFIQLERIEDKSIKLIRVGILPPGSPTHIETYFVLPDGTCLAEANHPSPTGILLTHEEQGTSNIKFIQTRKLLNFLAEQLNIT